LILTNRQNADVVKDKAGIRCRPAESREDYSEAFQLLYRQYCAAGLSRANPTHMRIAPHQLSPDCETIVVEQNASIIGTLSLIGDGKRKLPLDAYFPDAIEKLRREGLRLVEVGCLASEDRASPSPSNVYAALTRATIQLANAGGYHRMIAAVHPRHCKLYERGMGFQRISEVVRCDMVEGNLAVCVAGDPRNPMAYQEPWREIFFGASGATFVQRNRPMSPIDRMHFTRLLEIAERHDQRTIRRAA
jgi:hypothetical protein